MDNIIGLKELRENVERYAREIRKGKSFMVVRKSRPLFKLSLPEEALWETVADFTEIEKGNIPAPTLLKNFNKCRSQKPHKI